MALYTFNDNFQINAPKHIDTRYLNLFTPWANTTAANAGTPPAYRYLGLTLLIGTVEYWYQSGVADVNLVPKTGAATSITADNLLTLTGSNLQLGGTILHDTLLDLTGQNFKIYVNSTSDTVSPFVVSNSGVAPAILGQYTGVGAGIAIQGVSTTGTGVQGQVTTGVGIYGISTSSGIAGYFNSQGTNTGTAVSILAQNGSLPLVVTSNLWYSQFSVTTAASADPGVGIRITRGTSATAANGIQTGIDMYIQNSAGSLQQAGQLYTRLTNATSGSVDSQMELYSSNASAFGLRLVIGARAIRASNFRLEEALGAPVAAANNLTLGVDGNVFTITGNTQINAITTADWQSGSTIKLIFQGTPTLKYNTSGGAGTAVLALAGGVDYVAGVNDCITLVYNGLAWFETGRIVGSGGSGGILTANNGLTRNTTTNVQWGGTLIQNTTITANTFTTSFNATNIGSNVFNVNVSGTNASSIAGISINNTQTGGGLNYGIRSQVSGASFSSVAGLFTATGTGSYGVQGTGDTIGVQGTGNLGVFGTPNTFGQAGVKGDGTSNSVVGVWGVGNPGVFGVAIPGSSGVWGQSDGGNGVIAEQINSGTNNSVPALLVVRSGGVSSTPGFGTSILYQLGNSVAGLVSSNEMVSIWNSSTAGSESSIWTLNGVTNGTGLQPWIQVSGATAQFFGTGTAIVAINGATGIFTVGSVNGGTFEGASVGVQAINTSTSTNTVVTTIQSSRQGSTYLGANGSGTQFSFDSKNSAGAIVVTGLFRNYITNATAGSVSSQFDFSLSNLGTSSTVLTITSLGKIIANQVGNWVVAANNAAAIAAGAGTGEFYRNGDLVGVVH